MTKGKMEIWSVYIAGKPFCTVQAYTRKSARLQAKRMPNLRSGEIYVTRAKVAEQNATPWGKKTDEEILQDVKRGIAVAARYEIDWSTPDQLGRWGETGA